MNPEVQLLKQLPSKEEIINTMLKGSTTWWEDDTGKWEFKYAEQEDVYDKIFNSNHKAALFRVYAYPLSPSVKEDMEDTERHWFKYLEG